MPSATARKFLARDLAIAVNTGTIASPTWTPVKGLTSITHSPSSERTDSTTFDSAGRAEHMMAQRGDAYALEGFKLVDPADGVGDTGQEAVEAAGRAIGTAAEKQFKLTLPGTGADIFTFLGTVEVTGAGGGTNDLAGWGADIEVTGAVALT